METRFDELKRYVRFSDEAAARLVGFRERARPHFGRIAQEFYERIREHEDAHSVFTGEEQIRRLQVSLVSWLERLLGGVYDESYFRQTWRIGQVHVKVGLPQRYMFTAMALVRSSLNGIVDAELAGTHADAGALRDTVNRLIDLELAIMLESYAEDLTSRIERAAHVTQHRFINAVELAEVLVVGLGREGEIVFFNRFAERMTGWARDEAIGKRFVELLVPEDARDAYDARFGGMLVEGEVDVPLKTRAGKVRDVVFRIARAPAEDDVVTAFAIGADVTEERAARIRAQQHERLAAVGTLAAGLAHEIRNPLNGAQLHVSFLERELKKSGAGGADALEAVQVVRDEIKRLARLVTDFLDFARPRPLAVSETSVRTLCERALPLVASAAEAGRVRLELDLPVTDIVMHADRERLQQVLLNLLQNAVEALTQGGTVTLRARREPRHAVIEVEDDGPGLPSESAPIFDAFFSTKPTGTGLGLAIVHRIVMDHGGAVDVDSRPGRTRFRIRLPLEQHPRGTP